MLGEAALVQGWNIRQQCRWTDLDEHAWLVVRVGGEHLLLLCGDGGVPGDQRGLQGSRWRYMGQWWFRLPKQSKNVQATELLHGSPGAPELAAAEEQE